MVDNKSESLSARLRRNSRYGNIVSSQAKVVAQIRKAHWQAPEKDGICTFTVTFERAKEERIKRALEQFKQEMGETHTISWEQEADEEGYLITVVAR